QRLEALPVHALLLEDGVRGTRIARDAIGERRRRRGLAGARGPVAAADRRRQRECLEGAHHAPPSGSAARDDVAPPCAGTRTRRAPQVAWWAWMVRSRIGPRRPWRMRASPSQPLRSPTGPYRP